MRRSPVLLAALLLGAGAIHLIRPAVYVRAVPPQLPGSRRLWVYLSGVAEVLTGAGVLLPSTRRLGALGAALLFVSVFPANVQMFRDARSSRSRLITGLRLPLQIPLVAWAVGEARRRRG